MFLFAVDLCFVIPPSFFLFLSSLITVYAVVLCASLFLTSASSDPLFPQDLRQSAAVLSSHSSIPYKPLRLLSRSDFISTCPKPREKSEELKARLRKLEELAERKEYEKLMKDITQRKVMVGRLGGQLDYVWLLALEFHTQARATIAYSYPRRVFVWKKLQDDS